MLRAAIEDTTARTPLPEAFTVSDAQPVVGTAGGARVGAVFAFLALV
jgi:hypothetical protein